MKSERGKLLVRAIQVGGILAALGLGAGCKRDSSNHLQGYLEGEFVYVASPLAGTLEQLEVQRGGQIKQGDALFSLESVSEQAARAEAEQRRAEAQATLEDQRKGKRPSEIESLAAQLAQAKAALELSDKELARQEKLARTVGATTEQDVDRARSQRNQDQQRVAQLEADLVTARLGERSDLVAAAEAKVKAADAALRQADWALSEKQQSARQAGLVFDTLYRPGEWVPAGRPVVVLLPPENVKLRVFVPQARLSSLQMGDPVEVFIDGVSSAVPAKISFISPRAEYTPPVIYSRENREKFVFLVEATFEPETARKLHPGQPVDVRFGPSP